MDPVISTLVELSARPDIAALAGDVRAAWVFSADGARVLWTNAAGASFFGIRDAADLSSLSGLAKSPARPHISRIAETGTTDRMSTDRLRFYRGLRVMLLTCQCKRLELGEGRDAALIVSGDKGLMSIDNPMDDYLKFLAGRSRSVALMRDDGSETRSHGPLSSWPDIQAVALDGALTQVDLKFDEDQHHAIVARFGDSRRLAIADNTAQPPQETAASSQVTAEEAGDFTRSNEETGAAPSLSEEGTETDSVWIRAEDDETPALNAAQEPAAAGPAAPITISPKPELPASPETRGFEFKARKRPVRFAWKMDLDQRFTFVSDEFAQTLGPSSAAIVGKTWQEVREVFGIDGRGLIAHSLNRRDTWSGKTVYWPVSGHALRVPVDMAALPAFDRDRKFEGYRGFGVCRTADVKEDPDGPFILGPSYLPAAESEADTESGDSHEAELDTAARPPGNEDEPNTGPADDDALPQSAAFSEADNQPDAPEETSGPELDEAASTDASLETPGDDTEIGSEAQHDLEEYLSGEAPAQADPGRPAAIDLIPETPVRTDPNDATSIGARASALLESIMPDHSAKAAVAVSDDAASESGDEETTEVSAPKINEVGEAPELSLPDEASQLSTEERSEAREQIEPEDKTGEEAKAIEPGAGDRERSTKTPAGISGPQALQPKDIETAVKSLAKSFEAKRRSSADLFADSTPNDGKAADLPPPVEISSPAESEENTSAPETEDLAEAAELEHDQHMESADVPHTVVLDDDGGKVVPISDATPRLVPVDTSGLSRPDLAAFKKIAEALGAKFEGDLSDFDMIQEDLELEYVEPTPPPSGPIDPVLLDRIPIGIAIARDRDILYANETLLEFLGYPSLSALSEAGGLEALFAEEEEEDLPDFDQMDETVDGRMKARLADGRCRAVDARMHAVPWNGGRGLMISLIERPHPEPTAQPRSREDLESAQRLIAQMDTILETATDGVLVLSPEGTILKANRSAEALFNANRADMIGQDLLTFLAPESHRAASDYLDGLARNGVASVLNDGREVLGQVANSGLVPLFMTIGRIEGEGPDRKLCAVLRDITQWKTAEEELTEAKHQAENASSQKSDFLAKISHEIRTPLNAIIGFSEVMMDERFGPINNDRYKEYLKDIRTSGAHIMSLINDLLDLSKIEAGKMDLRYTAVSLNDVIRECVALMQPQANRERVIIRASLPDAVPNVVADARSVRQIVLNLLSNAIKFNKSGGQAIVSTALDDTGEVVLRVRDTGTGMSAKELASAMEPFRQLHTTRNDSGSGLGLPLTKALVEANRANFKIDSTPDQGTMVEITFPTQRVLSE